MFVDKLDDSKFTQKTGKNYRTPQKVNLATLGKKLRNKGYDVLEIDQVFRNVHARVRFENKIYFIKLATTPEISERVRNEINWNIAILTAIKSHKINSFIVPNVVEFGEIDGNTYYLSEYCDNEFIAYKNPARILSLEKHIPNVVDTSLFLINLPHISFIRDQVEFNDMNSPFEFFYLQDSKLCIDLVEHKMEPVLEVEKSAFKLEETCVTHGDFVPWHMFDVGGQFLLIDGEHGSSKLPLFYDIAYFYHRVFTGTESPILANKYLEDVYSKLPSNLKKVFEPYLRANLANRVISGFWHAKNEGGDFTYHNMLKEKLLEGKIL